MRRRQRRRRAGLFGVPALGRFQAVNLLTAIFGILVFAYLVSGRLPLLIALAAVVAFGMDRLLRLHPSDDFHGPGATAVYLFVPVLYALGSTVFLAEIVAGVWALPAAGAAALLFAFAAHAEYVTVDANPATYPSARFALSLVSYVTAFALFVVVFTSDLPLATATLFVAVPSLLLTVDILREVDVPTNLLFASGAAVAAVVAELRWGLYYLSLGEYLAGALLLIGFYAVTGPLQSYFTGHLDRRATAEYAVTGTAGLVIIAVFHLLSRSA